MRGLALIVAALALTGAAPRAPVARRMNEVQVVGSHNSFKRRIPPSVLAAIRARSPGEADALDYDHLPLTAQLDRGVRQLELDIFADQLRAWPNDPYLLGMVIHSTSRAAGDPAALARYHALVAAAPDGPPRPFDWHGTMVGWLAANIAWSTIKSAPVGDLAIAEAELRVALERLPDAPEVKATLGALQVARGDSQAGERLLIDALRVVEDPLDRADFCRYVAKARRDQGDEEGAAEADRLRSHILARAFVATG